MSAATRTRLPVPSAVGASLALDASPDRDGRSRLAVVAALAGVVAVVGSLTLLRGINEIADHPERTGTTWDLLVGEIGDTPEQQAVATITDDGNVVGAAKMGRSATVINGLDAPVYALQTFKGSLTFTTVQGRGPTGSGEIALAPATMRLLHAHLGDTVQVGAGATPIARGGNRPPAADAA
jgi:hypothetical protein